MAIDEYQRVVNLASEVIKVGTKFKKDGYLYHVLGIFDGEYVATKFFGKHKQWWHYEFTNMYNVGYGLENGAVVIKT